jgi:hypothetical protein
MKAWTSFSLSFLLAQAAKPRPLVKAEVLSVRRILHRTPLNVRIALMLPKSSGRRNQRGAISRSSFADEPPAAK